MNSAFESEPVSTVTWSELPSDPPQPTATKAMAATSAIGPKTPRLFKKNPPIRGTLAKIFIDQMAGQCATVTGRAEGRRPGVRDRDGRRGPSLYDATITLRVGKPTTYPDLQEVRRGHGPRRGRRRGRGKP